MKVPVYNKNGLKMGQADPNDFVYDQPINESHVNQDPNRFTYHGP